MELLQAIPKLRVKHVEENCTNCGKCVSGCPTGALEFDSESGRVVFEQQYLCIECCQCV